MGCLKVVPELLCLIATEEFVPQLELIIFVVISVTCS